MKKQCLTIFAVMFLCLTGTSLAIAQTCSASITNMNFGTVNLQAGGSIDTTATLNVSCSNTLSLQLFMRICPNLEAGSGSISGTTRLMTHDSNTLSYQFYQDANRTIPWGSTTNPSLGSVTPIDIVMLPLLPGSASRTIYGRILPSQASKLAGNYLSTFSGGQARVNYVRYLLGATPDCSVVTDNPLQPSFTVQANVNRSCTVSADAINFGTHGALTSNIDANGRIVVNCTNGLPYSISLNGGLSNAAPTQRRMTRGTSAVIYGLYSNSARTAPWGNTAGQIVSRTGTGASENVAVYGRVAPQATPFTGTYSDTVVVTINY